MPSCLGVYIEDNLIKYAKVSKSNETIKVESFGIKFYETINTAIKQIVEETYSFKLPISINTTDEWYNEIQVFSLLSKQDVDDAIKTEFENICYDKEINKNIYEQRKILAKSYKGDDKLKAIHISVPKTSIEQRKNQFSEYKISNLSPISLSIVNLLKKDSKNTVMIVNIEKDTTITKIINGEISNVDVLKFGSEEILEKINKKENSYAKAYEICKNATIYTEADQDLQYEENEYLEDIMPTLFKIVSEVRKTVDQSMENIEKIYITGTGALVNNIDIYFQDYLKNIQCEILKPSFVSNNSKVNIKDYIEVNSAIAIGLQGLEKNNKGINFKGESNLEKISTLLTSNVSHVKGLEISKNLGNFFEKINGQVNMLIMTSIMLVIMYFGGVVLINNQMDKKIAETNSSITETNAKIEEIQQYDKTFNSQTLKYEVLIDNIQDLNDANSEDKRYRNTIPNLLNNIMAIIPRRVQLISIENTVDTHIVIKARSTSYEEIAYFKAKLKTEEILVNVVSDTGTLNEGYLNVTIEGDLP